MKASTETAIRRVLNLLLYLVLCALLGTGLLMDWRLPPGREGGQGLSVWGWSRHDWGEVHLWFGYGFAILLLAHLWLARKWLVNIAVHRRRLFLLLGLLAGPALIAILLAWPVERESHDDRPRRGQQVEELPLSKSVKSSPGEN